MDANQQNKEVGGNTFSASLPKPLQCGNETP